MIGKHRDGGYAEFITVPGANAFPLPDEIPFDVGAIMMCSSATALHALKKSRFKAGESIAIFGFGGLTLRIAIGTRFRLRRCHVVEINRAKLVSAASMALSRSTPGPPIRSSNQKGNCWTGSRCRTRIDQQKPCARPHSAWALSDALLLWVNRRIVSVHP
jgi:hypothetical protein